MNISKEAFYIPNLIGYLRLVILIFFVFLDNPILQALLLIALMPLDILDGVLARRWNQTSLYGARLDLGVDIVSHSVITFYVGYYSADPFLRYLLFFFSINEIISHTPILFYMNENGGRKAFNHKNELSKNGLLLSCYYSKTGLFILNSFHGLFLVINVVHLTEYKMLFYVCFLGYLMRQICLMEQAYLCIFKRVLSKK